MNRMCFQMTPCAKTFLYKALTVCLFNSVALFARAAPILNFNIDSSVSGVISYAGGIAPMIGTHIGVDTIEGIDTPLNDGVIGTCVACTLNFTTGPFTGSTPATWEFDGPGSIRIFGGVDLENDGGLEIPVGSMLLEGVFNSVIVFDLGGGEVLDFKIAGATFQDTKYQDLVSLYGLPATASYEGALNISFSASGSPPGVFDSTAIFGGNVVNSLIPIPPAVWLFGSGLLGIMSVTRRRNNE